MAQHITAQHTNEPLFLLFLSLLFLLIAHFLVTLFTSSVDIILFLALQIQCSPIECTAVDIALHGFELPTHPLHGVPLHGRLLHAATVLPVSDNAEPYEGAADLQNDVPRRGRYVVPRVDVAVERITLVPTRHRIRCHNSLHTVDKR